MTKLRGRAAWLSFVLLLMLAAPACDSPAEPPPTEDEKKEEEEKKEGITSTGRTGSSVRIRLEGADASAS